MHVGGHATLHKSGPEDNCGMGFKDGAHVVGLAQQGLQAESSQLPDG